MLYKRQSSRSLRSALMLAVTALLFTTRVAALPAQQINFDLSLDQPISARYAHPEFPGHQLRVREPRGLCDPAVKQTSGYLDTDEGHHFFFWAFESRNDPKTDPVILWCVRVASSEVRLGGSSSFEWPEPG